MALMDMLTQTLGTTAVNHMAKKMGVDSKLTRAAISLAMPMLIKSLAKNASNKDGARSLNNALERDHDGSLLDNLTGFLDGNTQQNKTTDGAGILRHLLGDRRSNVEQVISRDTGLDSNATQGLLETLAPIVLGQLGKQKRQNNLDDFDIAMLLKDAEREQEVEQTPEQRGFIGSLLDKDGDGKIDADIAQKGLGILSSLFGRR